MADMLVRLYALDDTAETAGGPVTTLPDGVVLRPVMAYERSQVRQWIEQHFWVGWADEFEATADRLPSTTLLAVQDGEILGFACFDATALGFFGPTGVAEQHRGRGIGRALLMATLRRMRHAGYAYAIIGSAGPVDFYQRTVGATLIEDSEPGVYAHRLKAAD